MVLAERSPVRSSALLRPLGWSIAIHIAFFFLFSVSAGRALRSRPVGVFMSWALLTRPEAVIFLQPQGQPDRVPAIRATDLRTEPASLSRYHTALAVERLRGMRIPTDSGRQPVGPRIQPSSQQPPWPQRLLRPEPSQANRAALAAPVLALLPPLPDIPLPEYQPPMDIDRVEWKRGDIRWPPGKPARELGVLGPPLLTDRTVLSFDVPRPGNRTMPATYRFAVSPDGHISHIIPLSAPELEWAEVTYRALLRWRFASLPRWAPQDKLWGTVAFE